MNSPETFVRLLGSIREHLTARPVTAAIASVHAAVDLIDGEHVSVHLHPVQLAGLAEALLAWADTLTEITATAWRPPRGDSVHLAVVGRLSDGTRVEVWGGTEYAEPTFGADLQPGGRQSLALSVLRVWATEAVAA